MDEKKRRKDEEERTRALLADYLASRGPAPAPPFDDRLVRERGDDTLEVLRAFVGPEQSGLSETITGGSQRDTLRRLGYSWTNPETMALARAKAEGAPEQPAGKLPFMLGGSEVHEGPDPLKPMAGAAARAADWATSLRNPAKPQVQVDVGRPELVSRKPARAPLQVSKVGQGDSSSVVARAQQAGRGRRLPPGLLATAREAPEVAAHIIASDDELLGAQEAARLGTRDARLARALSMVNEAISGARYDREAYDDLEAGAQRPVGELLQRREQQRTVDEFNAQEAERKRRAHGEDLDRQYRAERDRLEDERERNKYASDQEWRKEESRQRRLDRAESRADRLARQQQTQAEINERARLAREQRAEDANNRSLQKLAKDTEDAGLMRDDINTIVSHLNREGNDLPGVGPIAGGVPEILLESDGTNLRQAAIRAYRTMLRLESGLTVTDDEARAQLQAYGMGPGKSEDAFRQGMAALAKRAKRALSDAEAGYDREIVDERRARGGVTSQDIPMPGPRPTGRVKRMRDGQVWAEMDDGSARRIR
jgi:hypothetical protein